MQPRTQRRIVSAWNHLTPWGKLLALVSVLHHSGIIPALVILIAGLYAAFTLPPVVTVAGVIVLYLVGHPRRRVATNRVK